MDIFNIPSLIKAGKIIKASDADPNTTYVQVGYYQTGNRQNNASNANAYASYVISLSELIKTGPKVFRALVTDDPLGGNPIVTVLEDTLSEGAGYNVHIIPAGIGQCYELQFTNPVLTLNKTVLPSSGNFAGMTITDLSGKILEAPEVIYNYIDAITVRFCAFNLNNAPAVGYLNNHYLEVIVFP